MISNYRFDCVVMNSNCIFLFWSQRSAKESQLRQYLESGKSLVEKTWQFKNNENIFLGQTSEVKKLIEEGVNVNIKFEDGHSPLTLAVIAGRSFKS